MSAANAQYQLGLLYTYAMLMMPRRFARLHTHAFTLILRHCRHHAAIRLLRAAILLRYAILLHYATLVAPPDADMPPLRHYGCC